MRRILFLDIDGVLRPSNTSFILDYQTQVGQREYFDPTCVGVLNAIIRLSGAGIVVHSTWRDSRSTVKKLAKWLHGEGVIGNIVGRTPFGRGQTMQAEIGEWLSSHQPCSYVVVDDSMFDPMPKIFKQHYYQTASVCGLVRNDIGKILKMWEEPR